MTESKKHSLTVVREPFWRITKRASVKKLNAVLIRAAAIVAALILNAVFLFLVTKENPISIYGTIFMGTFGTVSRISWAVRDIATLLCVGVALAPAFKMRFWNIGAEGQILIGGLTTAVCMIYIGDKLPTPLLIIVMAAASIVGGAIWGFIPAFFKAKWNTNETLFTLMMNYVAINLVACMLEIWRGQNSAIGQINAINEAGWFPRIFGERYTLNIIIVLVLTIAMYFYLKYTKHGYEIAVVGESQNTAKYAGINVKRTIIRTMIISGAICGICGFMTVAGRDQTISRNTAGGNGFTAIIVAWLAKFNTFYMALIAFLLVFLNRGANQISSTYNLNTYASNIVTGIILFFILGSEFFIQYKVIFNKKAFGKKTRKEVE